MEEVRYFGRIAVYALVVGIAYWFLSYEAAGTVLLVGFGLATGAGFLVLRWGARHAGEGPTDDTAAEAGSTQPNGPFGDESGPVPMRSAAPLAVGLGVAAIALAGAFGAWFLIAGAVPLVLGAVDWLHAAERELSLRADVDAREAEAAAGAAGTAGPAADAPGPAVGAPGPAVGREAGARAEPGGAGTP